MSNPYNGNQYPPAGQYNQSYPPAQPQYGQPQYGGEQQQAPYGQPSPYQGQTPYSPPPQPSYGEAAGSYGPPSTGGFQHGQQPQYGSPAPQQYGGYPPQGQDPNAYRDPSSVPSGQFPQQGAYNQQPFPADPNNPMDGPVPEGQEGERGLLGAVAGGAAGWYGGGKVGNGHSFLGAIAGAYAGHKLEEAAKHHKQNNNGRLF